MGDLNLLDRVVLKSDESMSNNLKDPLAKIFVLLRIKVIDKDE